LSGTKTREGGERKRDKKYVQRGKEGDKRREWHLISVVECVVHKTGDLGERCRKRGQGDAAG
jgi:hypothetical protein